MFDLKTNVLVVDDMATVRLVVTECLTALGFTSIIQATNGQMAWDLLNSTDAGVGLILSDWNMPKLTGVDFARLVRADKRHNRIPFILITTESESSKVIEAVKAGIDNYIVKPFTLEVFRDKLEAVYVKRNKG
jgi:two-component system chemotaxis response regulator CheY